MIPELFQKMDNQSAERWSLEDGYDDINGGRGRIKTYPYRVLKSGPRAGLHVNLAVHEEDLNYVCGTIIQGFKVILPSPI